MPDEPAGPGGRARRPAAALPALRPPVPPRAAPEPTIDQARPAPAAHDTAASVSAADQPTPCPHPAGDRAKADWDFRMDLAPAEYEQALAEHRRPLAVTSPVEQGQVRYAAVWLRYAPGESAKGEERK